MRCAVPTNSHTASENVKWYNHFIRNCQFPKVKHILTTCKPEIPLLHILTQEKWRHLQKRLIQKVYSSFISNSQKLEIIQTSINKGKIKVLHNGTLFNKIWTVGHNINKSQNHDTGQKKPDINCGSFWMKLNRQH